MLASSAITSSARRGAIGAAEQRGQRQWISSHLAKLALGKPFSHTQQLSSGRTILVTNQPLSDGSWVDLQEDITERCQAEEKISWLARHDALTEVPNRFHFHEQLDHALQSLQRGDGLAVHWIDIDHFKDVNDDLGHPAGDALLRSIGARLRASVRQPDFVGRLGGDEFAVVQMGVTSAAQATAFAKRILRSIKETHQYMGQPIDIGASIGIALAPVARQDCRRPFEGGRSGALPRESKRAGRVRAFRPAVRL